MFAMKIARLASVFFLMLQLLPGAFAATLGVTTTFELPVEITPAGTDHDFGKHAVTRLVDWNNDGNLDVLVGGGDGRVWIARNLGRQEFSAPELVVQLGNEPTTACYIDVDGDGAKDLIVAHSKTSVSWMANIGNAEAPQFTEARPLLAMTNEPLVLPDGCGGRIDAGDWDGDGDFDLVAGNFSGPMVCYRNVGHSQIAVFASEMQVQVGNETKQYSYNVHPTVFDVNQDGIVDIAYGMNWGNIGFLVASKPKQLPADNLPAAPLLDGDVTPVFSTGKSIDLREIAGDDATPTFGDVDGDGTLDMVSGGRHGKIFWLRGVPISQSLGRIDEIMQSHRDDLAAALESNETLRIELIDLHHSMYRTCQSFLNTPESRKEIREWYLAHIREHAAWLKRNKLDPKTNPYVPSLAYQTWTILMTLHHGNPDDVTHRTLVADTIGFEGRLKDILVEFGTLIIENGMATPNQQETLYSYLSQIPKPLLGDRSVNAITEVITIGDYLGPRLDVLHSGGVNIFANESGKPKSSENPFPKDYASCDNDYFGVVLAHELNHRVDATRFMAVPKYNQRYWDHMQKICRNDVKFKGPTGIGVDWDATKKHFADTQMWDGVEQNWNTAWANYWLTGPGKTQTLNVCRNETTYTPPRYGIPFFLETRQESIASLANQYFTDSVHMLQFAINRYERGYPGCLDEWLLMADVYSLDGDSTFLYRHRNGQVGLERVTAKLKRNDQGHIVKIAIGKQVYQFEVDENGLVEKLITN